MFIEVYSTIIDYYYSSTLSGIILLCEVRVEIGYFDSAQIYTGQIKAKRQLAVGNASHVYVYEHTLHSAVF